MSDHPKRNRPGRPTVPPHVEIAVRVLEAMKVPQVPADRELWSKAVRVLNEHLKPHAEAA